MSDGEALLVIGGYFLVKGLIFALAVWFILTVARWVFGSPGRSEEEEEEIARAEIREFARQDHQRSVVGGGNLRNYLAKPWLFPQDITISELGRRVGRQLTADQLPILHEKVLKEGTKMEDIPFMRMRDLFGLLPRTQVHDPDRGHYTAIEKAMDEEWRRLYRIKEEARRAGKPRENEGGEATMTFMEKFHQMKRAAKDSAVEVDTSDLTDN